MKTLFGIALGGCALAALVLFTGAPAEAKCGKASASGVGLGPEMAKEMAKIISPPASRQENEGQRQGLLFLLWPLHVGVQGQPARLLG